MSKNVNNDASMNPSILSMPSSTSGLNTLPSTNSVGQDKYVLFAPGPLSSSFFFPLRCNSPCCRGSMHRSRSISSVLYEYFTDTLPNASSSRLVDIGQYSGWYISQYWTDTRLVNGIDCYIGWYMYWQIGWYISQYYGHNRGRVINGGGALIQCKQQFMLFENHTINICMV